MKPYLYIMKTRILSALAYRFDVISSVGVQCLIMIASVFFWIAAYGNKDIAMGVTKNQMLTYSIMSSVIACVLTAGVEGRILQSIRKGSVALDILKPVNIFGMYLAEDVGSIIIILFQNVLPLLIIACLFIVVPVPASGLHMLLFFMSLIFSFLINWIFSAIYGMWAFWVINMNPLIAVKGHIIKLISGSIIPLWFFPEWFQTIMKFLPFQYIYQVPLSVYIGRLSYAETAELIGFQVIWVLILFGAFRLVQKKVMTNVLVQGG